MLATMLIKQLFSFCVCFCSGHYFVPLLIVLLLWNPDPGTQSCGTLLILQRWWKGSAGTYEDAPTGSNEVTHDIKSQYKKP